jgi:hypothetical protein
VHAGPAQSLSEVVRWVELLNGVEIVYDPPVSGDEGT